MRPKFVRRLGAAFACAVLLPGLASSARAAAPVPNLAEIRRLIAEAAGPVAENALTVSESSSSDGLTTVEHSYRRGPNSRVVLERGPFHTEHGVNERQAWHMNENGQIVMEAPDAGAAAPDQYTTTVAPVETPLKGYVIARLNARGHGTKEYVEADTWRILRRETLAAYGTTVTTYDDWREDRGRTFAHHIHTDDALEATTTERRILRYEPDAVTAAEIAVPPPRRALVEFPAGIASAELPARFGRYHVDVRVTIGDRGLDFVLDTGASGITIDPAVAHDLGLAEYGRHSAVTAGRYSTASTIVPEMRVGSLVMRNVVVREVPQGWNPSGDVKEVGLLGFDFLDELGVTIDYQARRVVAVPAGRYVPPNGGVALDVRLGTQQPRTDAYLNDALGERWIIDTGAAGAFLIFDYFARRHPDALKAAQRGTNDRGPALRGIGGTFTSTPYEVASLRLGGITFKGFTGYRVTQNGAYESNIDGLIGPDFLRLFTVGLDYARSRVYLVPGAEMPGARSSAARVVLPPQRGTD